MSPQAARRVLLLHAAATLAMAGLVWFIQVAHYPLFRNIPADALPAYAALNIRLTAAVVVPLMLVEAAAALSLPRLRPGALAWAGLALLAAAWLTTALLQYPLHRTLAGGGDPALVERVIAFNWIRTAAWSLRAALALALLDQPRAPVGA